MSRLDKRMIAAAKEGAAIARGDILAARMHIPAGNGLRYAITLNGDNNKTYLVTCPALPEVTTFGRDETEARDRAIAAIDEAIAARRQRGEPIPK